MVVCDSLIFAQANLRGKFVSATMLLGRIGSTCDVSRWDFKETVFPPIVPVMDLGDFPAGLLNILYPADWNVFLRYLCWDFSL